MRTGMHAAMVRRLWIAAYVMLLLGPLVLLAAAPPRGADRWTLFGICIGFVSLSTILLQLVTPSRAPQFTAPFGIGVLLRLHRYMGYGALLLVAIHVAVFAIYEPQFRAWLWPLHQPAKAQLGWVAAVALIAMVATSTWRRLVRLDYEGWRLVHILLGIVLVVGGTTHALLVSWYSAIGPLHSWTIASMAIGLVALIYLRVGRPLAAIGAPYVVSEVRSERGDATTVLLEAQGHGGLPFTPGQFAWLRLNGRPFALTEHPFSFASSAREPARPSFTVKRLGDFTKGLHERLRPGDTVYIDGPHGAWEPALPEAGFVLVVGGVGITPAMSIIRTCADLGDDRPIRLVYGARTWEDITFREELVDLQMRTRLEVAFVLSSPEPGWTGPTGFVDEATLESLLPPDATHRNYFVCGPPVMIDGVLRSLTSLGIAEDLVYADRFDSV
ncbi:MAG: oxidoreductase [Thermoleophilia bacterium]|nr:oxidoreductase [Thermoleophilia bacterium]